MSVSMDQLNQILTAFNDHDLNGIMEWFAEDSEFLLAKGTKPHGERFVGKPAIREILGMRFKSMPDIQWQDGQSWIMGDKALSEWRCDLWEFRQGKIVKKDTYYKQVVTTD